MKCVSLLVLAAICCNETPRSVFLSHCGEPWALDAWVENDRQLTLPPQARATLSCRADGVVFGTAFLNSYMLEPPSESGRLVGSDGTKSLLAGNADLMHAEDQYMRLLQQMRAVRRVDDRLVLSSQDGNSRLEFRIER